MKQTCLVNVKEDEKGIAGQARNDRSFYMKKLIFCLFAGILLCNCKPKVIPNSGNPLFEGWYADPEAIIYGDTYWIYPTWSDNFDKQTYFDCFSSKDLITWTKHASLIDTSEVKWAKRAMWAPSVIQKGGKYYFFFSANDVHEGEIGGIGVAVSDRPEGPYKDLLGKPLINEIVNGAQPIDQFVFHEGNDYYLYYGGWGHCNLVKLNSNFTKLIPFEDGETYKEITPKNYVEGPFMFKRNNKYYFMWSEGGWTGPNYSVAYSIADSPFGPFERIGKILQQDTTVATGAGHHSVINIPGTDDYYIVYHRHPLGDTDGNHRATCIDKMTFDEKGFINPVKITFEGVKAKAISPIGNRISVDFTQKGAPVSESMYGVFFEEINHAGDGGLYAELVQNRSFEEKEIPKGYSVRDGKLYASPVTDHLTGKVNDKSFKWNSEAIPAWSLSDTTKAALSLSKKNPLFEEAPTLLQITISDASTPVSVINSGYWGMNFQKDNLYQLRFYVKADRSYQGSITAKLLSADNQVIASQSFDLKSNNQWEEYTAQLTASATDGKGKLAIELNHIGIVSIDYVSLFPEKTFNNRSNGLRPDIAEFLQDLRPAFVRWPGGCVVEGITLDNRFEWKKTLGDPARRPGVYDTWGYRSSYGFGYHEFLQFCEDIKAGGMFVCNVGIGCQYRMSNICSDKEITFYVDDALDAIEYALGDVTSEWGAKRAAAGHPNPFPLKYVEIGNENWGPVYNARFNIFYKAIKEKYPQLTLISNHGLGNGVKGINKTDMIDPHWYVKPNYFFENTRIFDNQARGDYKIYVGEYACNSEVGAGNMLGALSEAAFISGMERNGDLVTMCSYAPLLENHNDREWPVNLIRLSSDSVIGRSSYYVQKMYAENKPTYNVSTELISENTAGERNFAVAGYDESTNELILKVINAGDSPWISAIDLKGLKEVSRNGRSITLSANAPTDENSFADPHKIVPVEEVYHRFGTTFNYTFKPNSFTILRLKKGTSAK